MATSIVPVTVPASGDGPAADISSLVGAKTVTLTGTFLGTYTLLASHDGQTFVPVLTFNADGLEEVRTTLPDSYASVRVRSSATNPSGVSLTVAGELGVGQNFFSPLTTFPAGSAGGTGAVVDLQTLFPPTGLEEEVNFICDGGLVGSVLVEGSNDGAELNPVGTFQGGTSARLLVGAPPSLGFEPLPTHDKLRYVRVTLQGQAASDVVVTVGGRIPASAQTLATVDSPGAAPHWPPTVDGPDPDIPPATAVSPGAMPSDPLYQRTETAGTDGVLANRIVYNTAGTVLHACANAIATATGIPGVTLVAAAGGASVRIATSGSPVRIKADSICAPAVDAKAYLSDESGGLVASSIGPSTYPRCIGYFNETVVGTDGCVEVRLVIDELRDHSTLWKLATWAPTVDSQIYDFSLNPALWDSLELRNINVNSVVNALALITLRCDAVDCVATAIELVPGRGSRYSPLPLHDDGWRDDAGDWGLLCASLRAEASSSRATGTSASSTPVLRTSSSTVLTVEWVPSARTAYSWEPTTMSMPTPTTALLSVPTSLQQGSL